jgi:hypothetical protein
MILNSEIRELSKQILLASVNSKQLKFNQISEENIKQAVDSASHIVTILDKLDNEMWDKMYNQHDME